MEEAIIALLASVTGGRRYWGRAPQEVARPFIVFNRISQVRGYTSEGDDGLPETRVQVDIYADTYTSARDISKTIVDLVSGYRSGAMRAIFVDGIRDLPASDAGEVNHLFRVSIDLMVWFREA
ncbi:DUF3168 domain-containing protein [Hoeflea sp. YIM 152468]|uniref:tail completion protein gp17 n=1 Tax=Hoeflea sp. YIM 152468 TaxID=3031759 RepID=UPI0023DA59CF|nr:DUF3168 domain-containing protein [Hoeflea sp. YIM 152468]MDF1606956.1 DUF3168 domain-containing protein [Hoeflea sp. YIM 152468]